MRRKLSAEVQFEFLTVGSQQMLKNEAAAIESSQIFGGSSWFCGIKPHIRRVQVSYCTITTGFPRISIRGLIPRPGSVLAAMKPFTRCGAPSAVLTVT